MKTKYTILIADDDPDIVKTLSDLLEYEGFATRSAYEGVRAMEVAHKEKPDLILLDLRMPAGTGQSVLQRLRLRPDTAAIPVIVLTALAEPHLEQETKSLGAKAFFRKPYDSAALVRVIRALLPK